MRDMIEMAIVREGELLDAVLEAPEPFELPLFEWQTTVGFRAMRTFAVRNTSQGRVSVRATRSSRHSN
jgi:hypothetical protein